MGTESEKGRDNRPLADRSGIIEGDVDRGNRHDRTKTGALPGFRQGARP
jgi:hypothetical protein